MNSPLTVSVITPSYNQGEYLEETILSVLAQTYPNIEYIIIDGGSTDQSVSVIKKYENQITYWVSEKDKGQADAINKGLKRATGDLVCWVNSDDTLYPDFVSQRVEQFIQHPEVDFIYGDVDQGKSMADRCLRPGAPCNFLSMLLTLNVPIPQQSSMWRKSLMDKIGYLEEKWHVLLDREYFMRIALHAKILYQPGAAGFFRNHELSKSIAEWSKWATELERYYTQLFENETFNTSFAQHKSRAMAAMYFESTKICLDCKEKKQAFVYMQKALKADFFYAFKKISVYYLVKLKHILK